MTDHPVPAAGDDGGTAAPPRSDPPLSAAFSKDPADERFLAGLNATLEPAERAAYRALPERFPTLHVVGAPRSGTTLLYQAVIEALDVGYIDNLTAAFWRAPVTGLRLARKLGVAPAGGFGSEFGRTAGIAEPHEFGYFWNHHLRYPDLAERAADHEGSIDWDDLRAVIVNMAEARAAPMAFKPMLLIWHMEAIARAMPRTCFAWIRRDPAEVAMSLLRMRRALRGDIAGWTSLVPARAAEESDPYRQVAAQALLLDAVIAGAAGRLGPDIVLEVRYGRLCAEPNAVVDDVRDLMAGRGEAPARRETRLPTFAPGPSRGMEEHGARMEEALAAVASDLGLPAGAGAGRR